MIRKPFSPTDEQRSLIGLGDGSFLVIAPPGSGKTTVLTERVARLVADPGDSFRVLALTFTNKAASHMRTKLVDAVGHNSLRVEASTIHSFCLDALQNYGADVGVPPNVSIYDNADDRIAALHRGLIDEGIISDTEEVDPKVLHRLLGAISSLKRSLVLPEEAPRTVEDGLAPLALVYAAYDQVLRRFGAMDFDDILFFAYRLFVTEERVARHYRRLYRYIVLDEAQDTTLAQYEVLRALCGVAHRNVMLVADADQSIFGFAGASTQNLTRFEAEFGATRMGLTQNFRCTKRIVAAANALIANNNDRITSGGTMTSAVFALGHIEAKSYPDESTEAIAVLERVDALIADGLDEAWCYPGESLRVTPEDVCILGRSRYVLEGIVQLLDSRGIPYQFSTGQAGVFESDAFHALEKALRASLNPKDALAWRAITRLCDTTPASHFEAPLEQGIEHVLAHLLDPLASVLAPLAGLSTLAPLGDVLRQVVTNAREVQTLDEQERADILADADVLEARWRSFALANGSDATLARFLNELAVAGRSGVDGPGIRVLTIHAAKGNEFRAVFLVGLNEGSFPDYRSKNEEQIADERRNAYVAITRAERMIHLSRPRTKVMPWGDEKPQRESRFLRESGLLVQDLSLTAF